MRLATLFSSFVLLILMAVGPLQAAEPVAKPAPAEPVAAGDDAKKGHGETEGHGGDHGAHGSRLTAERIPLQVEKVPKRPRPILELGEPFLGTGTLSPGFRLPTGAVWQPSLLVFGTFRTAVQSGGYQPGLGEARTTEAAARLDLFANLQLSGSERLVLGFRNFDQDGRFTSYTFDSEIPGVEEGSQEEFNAEIQSLFFEGDFGEIFPNISPRDFRPTDIGFSLGRQPIFFQEGILINDAIDGIGLTWNTLQPKGTSNFRTTFFYGWNNVNKDSVVRDADNLFGLFTSIDFPASTVDIDVTHVQDSGAFDDLSGIGVSAVQRLGGFNTAFRALISYSDNSEGAMLFSEISRTPHHSHDLIYLNNFWVVDNFRSAARGPGSGGPLGRAGINFEAAGIGRYTAPMSSAAQDVAGGALGYQMFFNHTRQQLVLELGARIGLEDLVEDQFGFTARYQMALGQRFVIRIDGYGNSIQQDAQDDVTSFGGRLELLIQL